MALQFDTSNSFITAQGQQPEPRVSLPKGYARPLRHYRKLRPSGRNDARLRVGRRNMRRTSLYHDALGIPNQPLISIDEANDLGSIPIFPQSKPVLHATATIVSCFHKPIDNKGHQLAKANGPGVKGGKGGGAIRSLFSSAGLLTAGITLFPSPPDRPGTSSAEDEYRRRYGLG